MTTTATTQTITVTGARPFTLNGERKLNRYQRADLVRSWRSLAGWQARADRMVLMAAVHITATPHLRKRVSQDLGACFPTVKACIDGLVDAGVLPSDGPDVVRSLAFNAPVLGDFDGLTLELVGEVG